jgi:hypothetical protein
MPFDRKGRYIAGDTLNGAAKITLEELPEAVRSAVGKAEKLLQKASQTKLRLTGEQTPAPTRMEKLIAKKLLSAML